MAPHKGEPRIYSIAVIWTIHCDQIATGRTKMDRMPTTPCPHPYSAYAVNTDGELFNPKGVRMHGHMTKAGYISQSLKDPTGEKHPFMAHRLVYWTFNPDFDQTHEVDHIDGIPQHNWLSNLQALSKQDHIAKTLSDNPGMFSKKGQGTRTAQRCQALIHTCVMSGVKTPYDTISMAMVATGLTETMIRIYAAGQQYGWQWDRKVVVGELWYDIARHAADTHDSYKGVQVSNLGRVRRASGEGTFGSVSTTGRMMFGGAQVSTIVCTAFHGPPCEQGLCVVHLNGIAQDNRPENLAWSRCFVKHLPPITWATPCIGSRAELMKVEGQALLQCIMEPHDIDTLRNNERVLIPLDLLQSKVENHLATLSEAELMAFRDSFKIGQDTDVLKTVRAVVRPVFGIRVARQHSTPSKKAHYVIQFTTPLTSYGKVCNPGEALRGMGSC